MSFLNLFVWLFLNFLWYKLKTRSWENSKICWSWLPNFFFLQCVEHRPPICACSVYVRCEHAGLRWNQTINMAPKSTRRCAGPSWVKNFAFLLLPPLGKNGWTLFWMKFQTFSYNSCLLLTLDYFTAGSFKNKAQFGARCCVLDPKVMWVTVFITWSLLLCLSNRSFDMSIYAFCTLSNIHNYWPIISVVFTSESIISHAYSNRAFRWGS